MTRRAKRNLFVFVISWFLLTGLAVYWEMTKGFGMPFTGLFLMPPAVAAALVGRCWALDHERLRHLRAIRVSRRNRSAAEKRGELLVVAIMVLIAIIVFWVCAVFA